MKSNDQSFLIRYRWALDALIVMLTWWGSYYFRFRILHVQSGMDATLASLTPLIGVVSVYTFFKSRVYDTPGLFSIQAEFLRLLRANLIAVLTMVVFLYFLAEERVSRGTLLIHLVVSTMLLVLLRVVIRLYIRWRRR